MAKYAYDIVLEGDIWMIGESQHHSQEEALDAALLQLEQAGYLWQTSTDGPGKDLPEASHVSVFSTADIGSYDYPCWHWFGSPILVASNSSIEDISL